jgi:hypothetical protein
VAADIKGVQLAPKFVSRRYQPDILKLGFSYVVFDEERTRNLGVAGHDPEELSAPHTAFHPDERVIRNEFAHSVDDIALKLGEERPTYTEQRVARVHLAWERRGPDTRKIKDQKGYVCEGCRLDAIAAFGPEIANSVIEAHHLKPVAEMPEAGRDISIDDFAVLCATCHRIIHRLESPDDLAGLRALVSG